LNYTRRPTGLAGCPLPSAVLNRAAERPIVVQWRFGCPIILDGFLRRTLCGYAAGAPAVI
jgi:hypothetical protein